MSNVIDKYLAVVKSIEQNTALNTQWMKEVLEDWKKNEAVAIAESGGSIIKQPFRDKKTKEWRRQRKWQVPVGWCLGVWTGATLYSLINGKGVNGISIISNVSSDRIEYGYKGNKYINFNVGVSESFLEKHQELLAEKVSNYIKEAVSNL